MSFFRKQQNAPTTPATPTAPPAGMVSLVKAAGISLEKKGLRDHKAAVYLVLDWSISMRDYYGDGSVQRLAEQALGLSANLDDDGEVPMIFFDHDVHKPVTINLSAYQGVVDRESRKLGSMGGTAYAPAIRQVIKLHQKSGAKDPAFVIFQTDGEPGDRYETEAALREASEHPIFFSFVGFGSSFPFLERLDTLSGRTVDNASLVTMADGPLTYDGLLAEYPQWLKDARAAGIIR